MEVKHRCRGAENQGRVRTAGGPILLHEQTSMSVFNSSDNSITCKLVYYGPGLGGKTSSLKAVHAIMDPAQTTRPVLLQTDDERTVFFDFLPLDLGPHCGHRIRLQGYTAPGLVRYNLTRRCLLMGVDGVVFVADSAPDSLESNMESLANLHENLAANGMKPGQVPIVFQFNKRDLPNALSVKELNACLNPSAAEFYSTTATKSDAVFDAFVAITRLVLNGVAQRYGIASPEPLGVIASRWLARLAITER